MHYSQEYANDPRNGYACAPTESGHAPAYYQGGELRQQRGNQPFQYVQTQSQSPTAQRVPMRINATPGYLYNGCWYNAGLQKPPVALVQQPEVQPALAPPQLQQQQHVPQFYMPPQHEQQQPQQHIFYPLQPQGQNLPLFYPSQQPVQVMPLTYPSQQQQQVIPTSFPSQQQQVQVLPLSYPSQQHQQQVLPLSYPLQQQEQAAPSNLLQQGQVMPTSYPSQHQQQQVMPPSYPLQQQEQVIPASFPSQQQQVMPPYQTYPSEPVPQYQVVPKAMKKAMPTLPVIMEETDGPENQESQEPQVPGATEAQETIKVPPQLVEICLGPGVQVTRSKEKLTIDIGLSSADKAETEKQGSLKDMCCKLFQMIKRYAFNSRVARARRNRLRHLVTKKRSFKASQVNNDNAEKSTLMEDKDTQTFETLPSKDPDTVPIQMEVLSALEEIPLPEDPIPELADSVFEDQEVPLIPLPGTLISEEHSSMEPQPVSKVDLIGKQDSAPEYLPDPGQQQEIAQPIATSEATPEPVYFPEEKILQPMIAPCLELIGKALIPPPPPPPLPLPEVFEELKEPIVDTTYWPPLGSRPPTKALKAKQQLTPEKPKEDSPKQQPSKFHRFNENRFMGSSSARMRILRKLDRCENHSSKIEVEVPKIPAADVQDSHQNHQSPKNDKKIQKSPQKSPQNQKPSVQNSKRNQSEPQAVARNMFALLEQLVEEPSPEISAEAKNQKADARQEKDKKEARKTKKLKRRLKKKERAQRIRLEAKEKAAKAAKEAMEKAIINVKDIPIPDSPRSLLKPKFNLQDMIPKPQRVPTKPTIDKAPKEAPAGAKPAGEGKPIAKKPETGEKDQVASLVASLKSPKRLRLRSPFLEAVANAHKASKETLLSRKRKLWEKRMSDV